MEVSDTVELRNAKIRMHNGHMRLVIDRWGLIIENSSREVADEIPKENFSDVEYELRD